MRPINYPFELKSNVRLKDQSPFTTPTRKLRNLNATINPPIPAPIPIPTKGTALSNKTFCALRLINLHLILLSTQHDVPHGKHALILVKQPKGNLVWISTQETAAANKMAPPPSASDKDKKFEPRLKTWNDCDYIQVIKSAFKCTLLLLFSIYLYLYLYLKRSISRLYPVSVSANVSVMNSSVFAFANFNEGVQHKIYFFCWPVAGKQGQWKFSAGVDGWAENWWKNCAKKDKLKKKWAKIWNQLFALPFPLQPHPCGLFPWFSTVIAPALCLPMAMSSSEYQDVVLRLTLPWALDRLLWPVAGSVNFVAFLIVCLRAAGAGMELVLEFSTWSLQLERGNFFMSSVYAKWSINGG